MCVCVFVCVLDLERRIQDAIDSKEHKAKLVTGMLAKVEKLRDEISNKANEYIHCSS